ncbi:MULTISPECIES: TetR/AcrR family transcriptional regulator [Parvimonas]|uniref:TetR/AcrR family transcriptional regulator n=1 Tax=Parvimonas TaxID=543311 RepID=UPI001CAF2041|nr:MULTISPECIES: TetR/AcrR family transcriptional regulator [Parvimonas]MBF1295394.1 TetR/AcrR family transcriptional regulator [Parvimonas sp.]MEB3011915.1 TetR/AcrR family transcriptional regulator [Parvimonas sp. D2]MEB3087653.1 TetR/AcrR family transcriptional regulator [Parvimonas sp. D4]
MVTKNFEKISEDKKQMIINKGIKIFSEFSFVEAKTDLIVKEAGISKGLLFYYFDNKKNFYLYLLNYAVDLLTQNLECKTYYDFFDNIFSIMDKKCNLIKKYPNETKFLNMASKETSKEVDKEIKDIFSEYHKKSNEKLKKQISNSIKIFNLRKDIDHELVVDALSLYIDAIVIKYLNLYQDNPMDLFDNYDEFKNSISKYLGLMLNGFLNTDCLR